MIKKIKIKKEFCRILLFANFINIAILFSSCSTIPSDGNTSKNLTPIELNQKAQEEIDNGNVRNALAYYEIVIMRYGSDLAVKTAAEYEIAHIYIKKKRWIDADNILKLIIDRYETAGGAGLAPKYLLLAKKDYQKTQDYIQKHGLRKNNTKMPETPQPAASQTEISNKMETSVKPEAVQQTDVSN